MQHTEATLQIFSTNEYSRFNMINGNRQLNEIKIKRIINEISNGNDMLRYYPIQVKENNKRLDILDGQHRFYICKRLKRPVFYILVTEEKSMPDIAKVNSNVEKWKPSDFVHCYIQNGNKNYLQVREFMDKYSLSLSVSLRLLGTGNPGSEGSDPDSTEIFRTGLFQVKHANEASSLAEECLRYSKFSNYTARAFVIAIYRIKKANLITMDDLHAAFTKRVDLLIPQANYKGYINNLEQIFNVGKHNRVVII